MHRWIAITAGFGILLIAARARGPRRAGPHRSSWCSASGAATPWRRASCAGGRPSPRPQPGAPARDGERWQIVAGKRLWLVERETGEVRACTDRDTSTVGVREIRCTSGELGRYGRSFGRDFNP